MWNKIMQDIANRTKPINDRQRELTKQITEKEAAISRKGGCQ
jgi:hypothetical protein